jgi:hypothetical protein
MEAEICHSRHMEKRRRDRGIIGYRRTCPQRNRTAECKVPWRNVRDDPRQFSPHEFSDPLFATGPAAFKWGKLFRQLIGMILPGRRPTREWKKYLAIARVRSRRPSLDIPMSNHDGKGRLEMRARGGVLFSRGGVIWRSQCMSRWDSGFSRSRVRSVFGAKSAISRFRCGGSAISALSGCPADALS